MRLPGGDRSRGGAVRLDDDAAHRTADATDTAADTAADDAVDRGDGRTEERAHDRSSEPRGVPDGDPQDQADRRWDALGDEDDRLPDAGPPGSADVPEPPTLAPPPASPWSDGLGRSAVRSVQVLLIIALVALAAYVLITLRLVVIPVLIATLVAAAASPLVNRLSRRGMSRALATALTLLAGIVVLGGIGFAVVAGVRSQWGELAARATEGVTQLRTFLLESSPVPVTEEQLANAEQTALDFVTGAQFRSQALGGASIVTEIITSLVLGLIILFFLLKDGPTIWAFLLRGVHGPRLQRFQHVGERAVGVLGGYVRGTAIIALADSILIGAGVAIVGVPLALPIALTVFVTAFIPLVGAVIAGVVAALVALVANGPIAALIVLGIVVAVNQIEGNVLAPVVLGKALALHPLAILLALTAGTILAGIIGALLSVPIAAVAWVAVKTWNEDKRTTNAALTQQQPAPAG